MPTVNQLIRKGRKPKIKRVKATALRRAFNTLSNRYVYYHCGRYAHLREKCPEPYIREEELVQQLLELLNKVSIDKLGATEKLQQEFERVQKFTKEVLGQDLLSKPELSQFDIKNYARYLLIEGSRDEKRELLSCLKSQLILKDRKIILKK